MQYDMKNTVGACIKDLRDVWEVRAIVLMKDSVLGLEGKQN